MKDGLDIPQGWGDVLFFVHCRCRVTGRYGMWVNDDNARFFTKDEAIREEKAVKDFQADTCTSIISMRECQ